MSIARTISDNLWAAFLLPRGSEAARKAESIISRHTDPLEQRVKDLEKQNKVLALKARLADRLPFCPDHRDKVSGKTCRECEIERLEKRVKELEVEKLSTRVDTILAAEQTHLNEEVKRLNHIRLKLEQENKRLSEQVQASGENAANWHKSWQEQNKKRLTLEQENKRLREAIKQTGSDLLARVTQEQGAAHRQRLADLIGDTLAEEPEQ